MVEVQSMVPIAAVVDLVLGIATLSILSRSQGSSANNRIVGCVLGWILVFLGLSYIMTSVLEFQYGALEDFSALDTNKVGGTFAFTAKNLLLSSSYMLMVLLPFFFPFRLINKEWDLWFLLAGVCIACAKHQHGRGTHGQPCVDASPRSPGDAQTALDGLTLEEKVVDGKHL